MSSGTYTVLRHDNDTVLNNAASTAKLYNGKLNERMVTKGEMERTKETAVAFFKILYWYLSGKTGETPRKPQCISCSPAEIQTGYLLV